MGKKRSIGKFLKDANEKLPWPFLGVFLAIVFGFTTIYLAIREKNPNVSFNIINEANGP